MPGAGCRGSGAGARTPGARGERVDVRGGLWGDAVRGGRGATAAASPPKASASVRSGGARAAGSGRCRSSWVGGPYARPIASAATYWRTREIRTTASRYAVTPVRRPPYRRPRPRVPHAAPPRAPLRVRGGHRRAVRHPRPTPRPSPDETPAGRQPPLARADFGTPAHRARPAAGPRPAAPGADGDAAGRASSPNSRVSGRCWSLHGAGAGTSGAGGRMPAIRRSGHSPGARTEAAGVRPVPL